MPIHAPLHTPARTFTRSSTHPQQANTRNCGTLEIQTRRIISTLLFYFIKNTFNLYPTLITHKP